MGTPRTAAALMLAYYRALDERDLSLLDDLFADDAEWRFRGVTLTGGAAVKRRIEQRFPAGLRLSHAVAHLREEGDTAIAEIASSNTLEGKVFPIRGTVICEARDGRIKRLEVYPDPDDLNA